jgi:hypothetical protein
LQQRDAQKAMSDYEAASKAMRDKTAKLRELRLAKEEADARTAADEAALALIKKVAQGKDKSKDKAKGKKKR